MNATLTIESAERDWILDHVEGTVRNAAEILREQPPGRPDIPADERRDAIRDVAVMDTLLTALGSTGVEAWPLPEDGVFPPRQLREWVARWRKQEADELVAAQRELEVIELKQDESGGWRLMIAEAQARRHVAEAHLRVGMASSIIGRIDADGEAY